MHAATRCAATLFLKSKRDLDRVATVVQIMPLLGCLVACELIAMSFKGICGDKWAYYFYLMSWLSDATWIVAASIAVSAALLPFHRHLREQIHTMETELKRAACEMEAALSKHT